MGHFAKVLNGIVQEVIVAEPESFQTFVDTSPGEWIETSYNTRGNVHYAPNSNEPDGEPPLRGNYARIGYTYDRTNDVFYPPKPFDSWIISKETNWMWNPPVPHPNGGELYKWVEATTEWVVVDQPH